MLGLHHRCLPENSRKIFQNTRRPLRTFKKVLFPKKEKYCKVGIPPSFFPKTLKVLVCLKTDTAIFTILKYLQLAGIFLEKVFLHFCKFMTVLSRILGQKNTEKIVLPPQFQPRWTFRSKHQVKIKHLRLPIK